MSQTIKDSYKNKAEAFDLFISPGGYLIGSSKFYKDCKTYSLAGPGKTVQLSRLLAYATVHLEAGSGGGDGDLDAGLALESQRLDVELKRSKVKREQIKAREEDREWMKTNDATLHQAALIGLVYDTINHHISLNGQAVALAAGADSARIGEIEAAIENLVDQAFNEIADQKLAELKFIETEEGHSEN